MLKEFVDRLLQLAEVHRHEVHGLVYTDKPLHVIPTNTEATVKLSTLTGLVDCIRTQFDGLAVADWAILIHDQDSVSLVRKQTDDYGRRVCLATVTRLDGESFPFGRWLSREEFVIGLQSRFVQDGDVREVLKQASSLEASTVALSEDDGISQRTTVRQGIQLKETVTVKGRVRLMPFRTFREVAQPASEFVFRLRSREGQVPECALFEADGGKWKLDAMLTIQQWLSERELGLPVIA